jgi:uridine kinase
MAGPPSTTKSIAPAKIVGSPSLNMAELGELIDTVSSERKTREMKDGRAPWWDETGRSREPFMIGVTGGTASGKTTVCRKIIDQLNLPWVVILSMDRFYRTLMPAEMELAHQGDYNFDHPDAFDWPRFNATLQAMKTGRSVEVPIYSFAEHAVMPETDTLYGADVVIVEGILSLYDKGIRDHLDLKIFVDADADLRLARRLRRDVVERGRTVEGVLEQYLKTVKPSFDDFIVQTKR